MAAVLEVMAKRKQATMITRVHGWRGFCPAALSPPRGRRTSSPGSLQHQNYDRTALKPKSLKPVCPNQKGFKNPTDPTRLRSFIISFQFMYCNVDCRAYRTYSHGSRSLKVLRDSCVRFVGFRVIFAVRLSCYTQHSHVGVARAQP